MGKNFTIFLVLLVIFFSSCKKEGFLAQTAVSNLNEDAIFKDSTYATGFLTNIYSNIGFSEKANRFSNGGLDVCSDEAEPYDNSNSTTVAFANGSVDANIVASDAYNNCYTSIRAVNKLLQRLPGIPVTAATRNSMKGEAIFLRAWYYSILLKHYGGVPIIKDTVYTFTDVIGAQRNTYSDCVNYISAQCDTASKYLPLIQSGVRYGRASKAICMALKMRVLLYAASPLFNDPSPGSDTPLGIASGDVKPLVGYTNYDANRWVLAQNAAKAVMDLGTFNLFTDTSKTPGRSFQNLFITGNNNSEYIWQVLNQPNSDLENIYDPPSRDGKGGGFPYQEMVDAFPMANGKVISDPTSGYDPNNPYSNRDPRLAYTVNRDQSLLPAKLTFILTPLNIYTVNGKPVGLDAIYSGTKTGYYCNKMLDPKVAPNSLAATPRSIPLIRYAEVLLSYAEASNEAEGPAKAYPVIELIRQRAGLNPYQLPLGLTKEQMRNVIQNERRLELAFEGHRFWDVRRWKLGATQDKFFTGMEVQRTSAGALVAYKRVDVRRHGFKPALYLWPLPQSEVAKSPLTKQNPGYIGAN
ncbi:RagB/SusD family nutrient uptake outer membrane protein [Mucilaginibacter sp. CSA2-8R]|uniref:RagB/SusD family nutrient uptake outer membrane protein n=1 Tax=Mucilaginibacter sp. CSA2-8R TaxID=3141542 RepID=UPI00315D4DE2